jgi:hypothetical protein
MTSMKSVEAAVYMRITDSQNYGKVGWGGKILWCLVVFRILIEVQINLKRQSLVFQNELTRSFVYSCPISRPRCSISYT